VARVLSQIATISSKGSWPPAALIESQQRADHPPHHIPQKTIATEIYPQQRPVSFQPKISQRANPRPGFARGDCENGEIVSSQQPSPVSASNSLVNQPGVMPCVARQQRIHHFHRVS